MGLSDRMAAFWASECGARGPALPHIHGDCMDPERKAHEHCPCIECGLTPQRWAQLISPNVVKLVPEREAGVVDRDDRPLELPQPGELGVPIMEPKMATGHYPGPLNAPGRGLLSPAWVEWALHYDWKT